MEDILNVVFGAGGGVLGSITTQVVGLFRLREERENRRLEYAHEAEMLKLQAASASAEREHEASIVALQTQAQSYMASVAHDTATGQASTWVINILRLVRPVLTVGIVASSIGVIYGFRSSDPELVRMAAKSLVTQGSLAVGWWFGDQTMSRTLGRGLS